MCYPNELGKQLRKKETPTENVVYIQLRIGRFLLSWKNHNPLQAGSFAGVEILITSRRNDPVVQILAFVWAN